MDRVSSSALERCFDLVLIPLCRYIDSWDALSDCFAELEREKILPSTK